MPERIACIALVVLIEVILARTSSAQLCKGPLGPYPCTAKFGGLDSVRGTDTEFAFKIAELRFVGKSTVLTDESNNLLKAVINYWSQNNSANFRDAAWRGHIQVYSYASTNDDPTSPSVAQLRANAVASQLVSALDISSQHLIVHWSVDQSGHRETADPDQEGYVEIALFGQLSN